MGEMEANAKVKEITIEATVIRANGDVEPQGVISYYHANPLRRAMWALRQKLRRT